MGRASKILRFQPISPRICSTYVRKSEEITSLVWKFVPPSSYNSNGVTHAHAHLTKGGLTAALWQFSLINEPFFFGGGGSPIDGLALFWAVRGGYAHSHSHSIVK